MPSPGLVGLGLCSLLAVVATACGPPTRVAPRPAVATATVRGRVTLPDDATVTLILEGDAAAGRLALPKYGTAAPGRAAPYFDGVPYGAFHWAGLLPGRLDVLVLVNGGLEQTLSVTGLEVRGPVHDPPELNPIDAKGRLRSYRIVVLDPVGQPVRAASLVHPADPETKYLTRAVTEHDGVATIVSADPIVGIFATGFRPMVARPRSPEETPVSLKEGIALLISGPTGVQLPEGLEMQAIVMERQGNPLRPAWMEPFSCQPVLRPCGSVVARLPYAGRYEVRMCVAETANPVWNQRCVEMDPVPFEVGDSNVERPVRIKPAQARIDAAAGIVAHAIGAAGSKPSR